MEPTMAMMVFAVMNRRNEREITKKDDLKDIATFAKKRKIEHIRNFSDSNLVVYSDSVDLATELLPGDYASVCMALITSDHKGLD